MDFEKEYILENSKVRLEPLRLEHLSAFQVYALSEPEIWKYSMVSAAGAENMEKYVQKALETRAGQEAYPFAVIEVATGKIAGSTRFYDISLSQKNLSIGHTWYASEFQGTGLNKAAKYLLFSFAFEELGMERVEFRADARNLRSIAAMKSIGCTQEGVLRSNGFAEGNTRRDSVILSVLKQEWEGKVKDYLGSKLLGL